MQKQFPDLNSFPHFRTSRIVHGLSIWHMCRHSFKFSPFCLHKTLYDFHWYFNTITRYEIFMDVVTPDNLNIGFLREFMNLPTSYYAPGAALKFRKLTWLPA